MIPLSIVTDGSEGRYGRSEANGRRGSLTEAGRPDPGRSCVRDRLAVERWRAPWRGVDCPGEFQNGPD